MVQFLFCPIRSRRLQVQGLQNLEKFSLEMRFPFDLVGTSLLLRGKMIHSEEKDPKRYCLGDDE
jgi:hypothetical protein